jgi:hypothetical protein
LNWCSFIIDRLYWCSFVSFVHVFPLLPSHLSMIFKPK